MLSKKTLKEIVDTIIDQGYEEDDDAILYIFSDGTWQIGLEKPNKDIFYFMVPAYEEEEFVEDKKMALMLDLSHAYSEWKSREGYRLGGKIAAQKNKAKGSEYFRELAKKRHKKT